MHVRAATNASTGNPLRGQVRGRDRGRWSLMATGLNTFCTWQWTTTATTTAYGDAVGNNFWLYFGVHVVGVGMRDAGWGVLLPWSTFLVAVCAPCWRNNEFCGKLNCWTFHTKIVLFSLFYALRLRFFLSPLLLLLLLLLLLSLRAAGSSEGDLLPLDCSAAPSTSSPPSSPTPPTFVHVAELEIFIDVLPSLATLVASPCFPLPPFPCLFCGCTCAA